MTNIGPIYVLSKVFVSGPHAAAENTSKPQDEDKAHTGEDDASQKAAKMAMAVMVEGRLALREEIED